MVNTDYAPRTHIPLRPGATFVKPDKLSLEDPAQSVMTDFCSRPPVTTSAEVNIDDALEKMKLAGVQLLLVVNQGREMTGIISAKDIVGPRPIKVTQEQGIQHRDITVAMIMTPLEQIEVLDMNLVNLARIGNIVATLSEINRQHTLVVEHDKHGRQMIRGMFSTTQISRQLGYDVATPAQAASSFAEIVREIA